MAVSLDTGLLNLKAIQPKMQAPALPGGAACWLAWGCGTGSRCSGVEGWFFWGSGVGALRYRSGVGSSVRIGCWCFAGCKGIYRVATDFAGMRNQFSLGDGGRLRGKFCVFFWHGQKR